MVKDGVQEELIASAKKYGWQCEAYKAGIYKTLIPVVNNGYPLPQALKDAASSDMRLAKRQMTWLKRNPDIEWFVDSRPAKKWLTDRLSG
jgi:tRNA A37 N6-isopentenylltransferase MiaA